LKKHYTLIHLNDLKQSKQNLTNFET